MEAIPGALAAEIFQFQIKDHIKEARQMRRRRTHEYVLRAFAEADTERALI